MAAPTEQPTQSADTGRPEDGHALNAAHDMEPHAQQIDLTPHIRAPRKQHSQQIRLGFS